MESIHHHITCTKNGCNPDAISARDGENITPHGQCRGKRDQYCHPDFRVMDQEDMNYVVPILHDSFFFFFVV
jgi:hypothetical protein